MKKAFNFLLLISGMFIFSTEIQAQHFDWAASGGNLFTGFHTSCFTNDGRIVAAMNYSVPNIFNGEKSVFYSGSGNEREFDSYTNQAVVVSYASNGEINWLVGYESFGYKSQVVGIAAKENGEVVVAFTTEGNEKLRNTKIVPSKYKQNDEDLYITDYVYFATLDPKGRLLSTYATKDLYTRDWTSFYYSSSDKSYVLSYADHEEAIDYQGVKRNVAHNYTIKLNADFTEFWRHKVMYLDESCCTFSIPACKATVAKNGDVYVVGTGRIGLRLDGSSDRKAPVLDEITQYNKPYESYLAKLDSKGKLLWVKYSEGKSLIYDVKTDGKRTIISGNIRLQGRMFGQKIDTTNEKKAFLASFDPSGKVNWMKTFNATEISSLSLDSEGRVYAFFRNRGKNPKTIIEKDTIAKSQFKLVIACFNSKGEYRWNKTSDVSLSTQDQSLLLYNDACGNLFLTGEMWYVLPVNMNIFDAAIVKGRGYGGAPLVGRIKTTIPDEVIEVNPTLAENSAGNGAICYPSPYPWKMLVYPNPTTGQFTVRFTTSYNDKQVSIELWDLKGVKVKELMKPKPLDQGTYEEQFSIMDLANGTYILVLKGTGNAITEKLVLRK